MVVELIMVVLIMYMILWFMSLKVSWNENMYSSYECGFDPLVGSRLGFSYRFFLISILFLVFDVEISLLLPIPFSTKDQVELVGFLFFMFLLIVGLMYEYYNGALEWVK